MLLIMGKKVIVSEKVLKSLLMEMAKERMALNEIKAELAYTRFYEGKIDRETYAKIMAGSKNMTPFHKRVLDIICSYEGELPPDIQQLPEMNSVCQKQEPDSPRSHSPQ